MSPVCPVAVEVGGTNWRAPTPEREQDQEIPCANGSVAVQISRARRRGGSIKEVCRSGFAAVVVVPKGPDDDGGAADRDGAAEAVTPRAVVGKELEELIAEVGAGRSGAQNQCSGGKQWHDEMSHVCLPSLEPTFPIWLGHSPSPSHWHTNISALHDNQGQILSFALGVDA